MVFKIQTIMVSAERIESSELRPPHAQLFFCVLEEPTNVGTDVRYAKQIELQHPFEKKQRVAVL